MSDYCEHQKEIERLEKLLEQIAFVGNRRFD